MKKMRELFERSFDFWNESKYFQAIEIWKKCLDEEQFVDEIVDILEEAFCNRMKDSVNSFSQI